MMLEPVTIRLERDHEFVGPKVKNARCKTCRRGRHFIEHLGYPEPLANDSGTDPLEWQRQKRAWQEVFGEAIHLSGLPRDAVESMQVIVMYTFEDRQRRDRDNLVYPLCKFLGDTLVRGRYWTLPYEAIDWTDAGMVPSAKTGKPLKSHRRLYDPGTRAMTEADAMAVYAYGQRDARIIGAPKRKDSGDWEPVYVADPLGGWIPDDRWDRFEVIEMRAQYSPGVEALEVMFLPSDVVLAEWPPAVDAVGIAALS